MKAKQALLAIVIALILSFNLSACGGLGDWDYELPGGYEIVRFNSEDISFIKDDRSIVLDRYIISFCFEERYIGLQRYPVTEPYDGIFDIREVDTSNPEFYLVDARAEIVYGPLTREEYDEHIIDFGITEMGEWIDTDSDFEGKNYG